MNGASICKRARAGEAERRHAGRHLGLSAIPSEILLGFTATIAGNAAQMVQSDVYGRGAQGEPGHRPGRARQALSAAPTRRCTTTCRWSGSPIVKAYVPVRKNVEGFKLHFLGGQPFGGVVARQVKPSASPAGTEPART